MAFAAGQVVTADDLNTRVGTTEETSDSSTFTGTRVAVITVVTNGTVKSGEFFRVKFHGRFASTVAGDEVLSQIRTDDKDGTILTADEQAISETTNGTTVGTVYDMEAIYEAGSDGAKTFVVTGARSSGSGDCKLEADGVRPAYLYVEKIHGETP